jgi:uncharacterized protein YcbK (DUF882 family)
MIPNKNIQENILRIKGLMLISEQDETLSNIEKITKQIEDRIRNIFNNYCSLKNNRIVSNNPSLNNMSWEDYVKKFNVDNWEIDMIKKHDCSKTFRMINFLPDLPTTLRNKFLTLRKMETLEKINPSLKTIFLKIQKEFGERLNLAPMGGLRNLEQNKSEGGATKSSHLTGHAIDIYLETPDQSKIKRLIDIASANGILGIGVYSDAQNLHLDIDASKGRRAYGSGYSSKGIPSWAKQEIQRHLSR